MAMQPERRDGLERRAMDAAEAALAARHYVSPIEILMGIRLLAASNLEAWRKGRLEALALMMQGSGKKIDRAMRIFIAWARAMALEPSEVA
jgi:hypothetical protein